MRRPTNELFKSIDRAATPRVLDLAGLGELPRPRRLRVWLVFGGYPADGQVLVVRGSWRTGVTDLWYQERAQPGWGVSSAVW